MSVLLSTDSLIGAAPPSLSVTHHGDTNTADAALSVTALPEVYAAAPQADRSDQVDSLVGLMTHRLVAELVPLAQGLDSYDVARLTLNRVGAVIATARTLPRKRAARQRVASHANAYLRVAMPPAPAVYLGAEVALGSGRVDLLWEHPTVGIFVDELKTWRWRRGSMDTATTVQVRAYAEAGTERWGDRFAGVRVLPLSALDESMYMAPRGLRMRPLAGSPLDWAQLGLGGVR